MKKTLLIILALISINANAAFVLSGGTITQSGTDANLSGLSAIAGVITTTAGNQNIYNVGVLQLAINGNLTIDPRIEELVSSNGNIGVIVNSGGVLNLGRQITINGYTYQTKGVAYRNGTQPSTWFAPQAGSTGALVVASGGTLNWYGATVSIPLNGFGILAGSTFNAINAVCEAPAEGAGGANVGRAVISGIRTNATINGFRMTGGELLFSQNSNTAVINGLSRDAAALATFPLEISNISFLDLAVGGKGNTVDVPVQTAGVSLTNTTVINSETGTNLIIIGGENGTDSRNRGYVSVKKRAIFFAKTALEVGIQSAVVYIKDKNNGARKNLNSIDDTADKLYINSTTATGNTATIDIITGIVNAAGTNPRGTSNTAPYNVDLRGNTNTLGIDDFTATFLNYGYQSTTLPILLKGVGTTTYPATMQSDANVTLSETNAIAKLASSFSVNSATNTITITANSTLDDLYDIMKVFKTRPIQAQLEYPTISTQPINAVGATLVTTMNIVGLEFLTAGVKFQTLQANATANGAFSIAVIGTVTQAIPTNLVATAKATTLAYNTNTVATVTYATDVEIGTLRNDGTGIITASGGVVTVYTDAEINFLDSKITTTGVNGATIFATENDRNANINAGASLVSDLNFKFGGVLNGVLMSGTVYLRVLTGNVTQLAQITLTKGTNTLDLGTSGLLNALDGKINLMQINLPKINRNVIKASKSIPASETF